MIIGIFIGLGLAVVFEFGFQRIYEKPMSCVDNYWRTAMGREPIDVGKGNGAQIGEGWTR